jgi:hypothetical protein
MLGSAAVIILVAWAGLALAKRSLVFGAALTAAPRASPWVDP